MMCCYKNKAKRKRSRRNRIASLFRACKGAVDDDEEDRRNTDTSQDFNEEQILMKKNDNAESDETEDGQSTSSEKTFDSDVSANERRPQRPNSLLSNLVIPVLEQKSNAQFCKILKLLIEQSGKLDDIIGKLAPSTRRVLRDRLDSFCQKVNFNKFETEIDGERSFNDATESSMSRSVLDSRNATEHDETSKSPRSLPIAIQDQVKKFSGLENWWSEAQLIGSDTALSYHYPTEHTDDSSLELSEIIRNQFEELKSCALKHSRCYGSAEKEVLEVVREMEAQVKDLPKQSARQLKSRTFLNSKDLGRAFLKCSYPSPVTEIIEMEEFSPSHDNIAA